MIVAPRFHVVCRQLFPKSDHGRVARDPLRGQRSNQLNYVPDSEWNAELVGSAGLEPATSCL
jgi:hypothetical protein